ncbi:MAG: Rab family GTPase [Promethearchaeota archaeon]
MNSTPKLQRHSKMFKIALLGEGGVGKSTLLAAKCNQTFNASSKMTIGIDFACVPIEDDPDQPSALLAFDLGGQERFQFIHDSYISGIKVAIIIYDLTRFKSFDNIDKWNDLIMEENPNIPILLVGAKKDLVDSKILDHYLLQFEEKRAEFPNSAKFLDHLFVSSKTFEGIEEVFVKIHEALIY